MKPLLVNNEVLLYGDVGDPWGWGDGFTAGDVATALAEHGAGDLTVRINSGGGIATEGMAIYSLLKSHDGKVTTMVDGVAASAASLIAMAGADRQIRQGATMMIHDPSGITLGTEDDHVKAAGKLNKLATSYAGVYAAAAGMAKPDARAIMKAETWFTADEAVEKKFATSTIENADGELPPAMAQFDYRIYARAPRDLPVRVRNVNQPAATAAIKEPTKMKKDWAAAFFAAAESSGLAIKDLNVIVTSSDTLDAANAALEKAKKKAADDAAAANANSNPNANAHGKPWAADFYASAAVSGLDLKDLNPIVAGCATLAEAKDKLIDAMATAHNANKPAPAAGHISITADARDKMVTGMTRALIAKTPLLTEKDGRTPDKEGERNEFSSYTLRELVYACLEANGVKRNQFRDLDAAFAQAIQPVYMAGAMSTSDFVNVLANVANKSMLKGYEEAPETFQLWTGKGTLGDFKTATRVDLGLFPSLAKVQEGAEFTYAKMSDRGVTVLLATYGKIFPITRQAIINDDLGAFTKTPAKMGSGARRTVGDLVYAVLTANANMPDGNALFSVAHANLLTGGTSVLSADSADAARTLMGVQKDPDNIKAGLNFSPFALIVPKALEGKGKQLNNSQAEPGQANPSVGNRVANFVQVVAAEARLDAASSTAWYLAANPAQVDTIEVDYLNGVETPMLEQQLGWTVDGVEMKVRLDAGVNLLDFRGMVKSAGV